MVKAEVNTSDHNDAANSEPEHCRKLFIGGLTPNTTEDMMRDFYGKYGELVDVVVMRDPTTKRTRGFGFVTYAAKTMVDECQKARPHVIDGKTVDPKRAVPRDANDRGAGNVSSKRLYVSGIREEHTEEMLQEHFAKFGTIEKVDLIKDKLTTKNRGFAFVTFDDYDCVDQCVILKSHQINGYRCDVKKGLSKEETAKAQQTERDRAERNNRSRGDELMGGRGRYDQGGRGGSWGGGYGGGHQQGGGWSGYGGQHGGGGGGYGAPQAGYGGGQGGGWGGAPAQQTGGWGAQQGGGGGGAYGSQQGAYGAQPGAYGAQQGGGGGYGNQQAGYGGQQGGGGYGGSWEGMQPSAGGGGGAAAWAGAQSAGAYQGAYGGGQGGQQQQQGGRKY